LGQLARPVGALDGAGGVGGEQEERRVGIEPQPPARLRGGRGPFGWVKALPWDNPYMLAVAYAFVMLGLGGAGGIINMSYQLDETIHNTQWITGHFHLIFAGSIVSMYFVLAYDLWPQLTGCKPVSARAMRWQLTLWFVGMLVVTLPWHFTGLLGMPRRMAYFDYSHPAIHPQAWGVAVSAFGGVLLVASGLLFVAILFLAQRARGEAPPFTFSLPLHAARVPSILNGFALWVALMIGLTLVNYGFPIWQLATLEGTSVPVVPVGERR